MLSYEPTWLHVSGEDLNIGIKKIISLVVSPNEHAEHQPRAASSGGQIWVIEELYRNKRIATEMVMCCQAADSLK